MNSKQRKIMSLLVGAALIIVLIRVSSKRRATPAVEDEKTSAERVMLSTEEEYMEVPAQTGARTSEVTETSSAVPVAEIMPQDEKTMELFQEASSRAMIQLRQQPGNMPYAVAASAGLRKAIADLGHDPDRTLLYWLSPRYQADVKKTADPVSLSRTTENLLSIAFGDQAGENDFALILEPFSPELREVALQRRAGQQQR